MINRWGAGLANFTNTDKPVLRMLLRGLEFLVKRFNPYFQFLATASRGVISCISMNLY